MINYKKKFWFFTYVFALCDSIIFIILFLCLFLFFLWFIISA